MVELYGRRLSRAELERRTGSFDQMFGIDLVTADDGAGRGVRVLQARCGELSFRVAVDRGFDLLSIGWRGVPIGWQSPVGLQNPALHAPELEHGLGFLRSFTGLLATCGLDHYGGPAEGSAAHFGYPHRKRISHALHGRISQVPARLAGYGIDWQGDEAVLWCEGIVLQAALFGEVLELRRRISAKIGGSSVAIDDVVTNRGFRRTPHMVLYHFNFGYPLLDEGAELLFPTRGALWTSHDPAAQGVGWQHQVAPVDGFVEQVYEHDIAAATDGAVPAALVNEALGLGVRIVFDQRQLPTLLQWQCLQTGIYAMGIEPGTNHAAGPAAAEERGELIWLGHGDSRPYNLRLEVLDGAAAIADQRARIAALAPPRSGDPASSGQEAV